MHSGVLKGSFTPHNYAINSDIIGITTPSLLSGFVQNDDAVQNISQSQFTKSSPDSSNIFEGTDLTSVFDHKLLKISSHTSKYK